MWIRCLLSEDGRQFQEIKTTIENFTIEQKDYNYWQPIGLSVSTIKGKINFLKLRFEGEAQIGRVEIEYR